MKPFNAILVLGATLSTVTAFPHMLRDLGVDLAEFEAIARRDGASGIKALKNDKRQTQLPVSIVLPALTVPGLNIPNAIDIPGVITVGTKVIPDAAHPFQAPGPTDQRGGCPGLNIMANYGYTSRTGVISAGDILYACTEMLGYSMDLALVLVALAIRSGSMDVTTLKMSIGGKDSRTNGLGSLVLGAVPGLFDYGTHNRYEVDGSMAYDDEYFHSTMLNAGGQFNGTRWAALQKVADANGGLFDINFHSQNKYNAYMECIATNPTCTWNVVGSILFYAADTYTYLGMATTDPATGQITAPTTPAIQSFFGIQASGASFVHVAEKLLPGPDGHWYRRSVPLTTAEIAAQGVISYARHPVPFGANDGKHVNSFAPSDTQFSATAGAGAFCLILNQIQENDGVLGQQFSLFAGGIAAILASLVAPARAGLSCGSQ